MTRRMSRQQGRFGITVCALAGIAALAGCHIGAQASAASTDRAALATQSAQCMARGRFSEVTAHFDSALREALSADQLEQAWQALVVKCGALTQIGDARLAQEGGFDVVFVPCEFAQTTLDAKFVFDKGGRIAGLWFVSHASAEEAAYSPPGYADRASFEEREVTVGGSEWPLPGTLSVPKGSGRFPAVVLVHGSGPQDRDETVGANKPFRDLAYGLASRGVVVLRYEKRTKVYGAKAAASAAKITVREEVVDDALAAIALLRRAEPVNPKKVFVLGHSLGGMLLPRIGKADPNTAGLIVMAGPTRPLEDILLDQMTYLASVNGSRSTEDLDVIKRKVAAVKSPELSASTPPASLPLGVPAAYWLDLRGYHPEEAAKSLSQPLLIIQGGRDYQVGTADYEGWRRALSGRPGVTFRRYLNLNHLFMEGVGKSTPQEYEKRSPVAKAVIEDLVAWIKAH